MTPYAELLNLVVDRLRATDDITGPPAILVVSECEEPSADRPGDSENIDDRIAGALNHSGVVVVVYLESVSIGENMEDVVEIRIQVVENIVANRYQSGTKKPNIAVTHCVRSALDGYQDPNHEEWAPIRFIGINTLDKGLVFVRELALETRTMMVN